MDTALFLYRHIHAYITERYTSSSLMPFEGVGVKFIRIFKTNNCQLVYYKDVLAFFLVVE